MPDVTGDELVKGVSAIVSIDSGSKFKFSTSGIIFISGSDTDLSGSVSFLLKDELLQKKYALHYVTEHHQIKYLNTLLIYQTSSWRNCF